MTESRKRGFAAMSPERQRQIAGAGGKASHAKGTAHEFTSDEARAAGQAGGEALLKKLGREHFRAIGKKGGATVSRSREHMSEIGRKGGKAVSENKNHMADIGRKGGAARKGEEEDVAKVEEAETGA